MQASGLKRSQSFALTLPENKKHKNTRAGKWSEYVVEPRFTPQPDLPTPPYPPKGVPVWAKEPEFQDGIVVDFGGHIGYPPRPYCIAFAGGEEEDEEDEGRESKWDSERVFNISDGCGHDNLLGYTPQTDDMPEANQIWSTKHPKCPPPQDWMYGVTTEEYSKKLVILQGYGDYDSPLAYAKGLAKAMKDDDLEMASNIFAAERRYRIKNAKE